MTQGKRERGRDSGRGRPKRSEDSAKRKREITRAAPCKSVVNNILPGIGRFLLMICDVRFAFKDLICENLRDLRENQATDDREVRPKTKDTRTKKDEESEGVGDRSFFDTTAGLQDCTTARLYS